MTRGRKPSARLTPEDFTMASDICVKYREKFNLTQLEMASELGTYPYVICNIETRNNARPGWVVAAVLALADIVKPPRPVI